MLSGVGQSSLFEPVGPSPLTSLSVFIDGLLVGELALALCSIAIALVGISMLTGRLALRRSALVVAGCAMVAGAPIMASSFVDMLDGEPRLYVDNEVEEAGPSQPSRALPPAERDPYLGA